MEGSGSSMALFGFILALMTASISSLTTVCHAQSPWEQLMVFPLQGMDGDEVVRLAMTEYDLSIAGFTNRTGHWHAFPEHVDRIPKSTPLRFDNSYHDLIGGLANLPSLSLGREPVQQATRVLFNHHRDDDDDDDAALKRALATLTVVTTQGQWLTPIKETLAKGWDTGDARVAVEHLPYIEHWDAICHEIVRAHKNGRVWDGPFTELLKKMANIHSLEDALSVVSVIGNRTMEHVLTAHARSA